MTGPLEDKRKEAFRLFEEGKYEESLLLCTEILVLEKDPAIEILAATNHFHAGRPDEAGLFFRDLAARMPESSYVHSYLGRILEALGDEGAIAEYAIAVRLDPANQEALRSYAEYLIARRDYRGAVPVLKKLLATGSGSADRKTLMRALIETGEPDKALATHAAETDPDLAHEYLEALVKAGRYGDAAATGLRLSGTMQDPEIRRTYLDALARHDPLAALQEYEAYVAGSGSDLSAGIVCDYILLLREAGRYREALDRAKNLLVCNRGPAGRLLECELLGELGDTASALTAYETLVKDEIAAGADPDILSRIISRYRRLLAGSVPVEEATRRFLSLVSGNVSPACLLETARFFEEKGENTEARSWYYRAYRADFLFGGPPYARFLLRTGEDRECEKVMLYLLANAKKGPDLIRVASVIVDDDCRMYRFRRLMEQLERRLSERRSALGSDGLEILSVVFFIMATSALSEEDYASCKYFCLCGMDVIPRQSSAIRLDDFVRLIQDCKEGTVADRPIMHTIQVKEPRPKARDTPDTIEIPGLSPDEAKIVSFLRSHRKASERDLRTLLGTRRVAGIVNRIIKKSAAEGITLITKKGVGEDGEIYEYSGT